MDLPKFEDAEKAIASLNEAFSLFRQAVQMARDTNVDKLSGTANNLLKQAETTSREAEAALAKILGYQLCQCQFPPSPMLMVGYRKRGSAFSLAPVFECRLCNSNTAMPETFKRLTRKPRK